MASKDPQEEGSQGPQLDESSQLADGAILEGVQVAQVVQAFPSQAAKKKAAMEEVPQAWGNLAPAQVQGALEGVQAMSVVQPSPSLLVAQGLKGEGALSLAKDLGFKEPNVKGEGALSLAKDLGFKEPNFKGKGVQGLAEDEPSITDDLGFKEPKSGTLVLMEA